MAVDNDHVMFTEAVIEKHQARLAVALATLEKKVADYIATAPLNEEQLFDLEWAIKSRAELRPLIQEEYLKAVDEMIRDFRVIEADAYEMLDNYGNVARLDPQVVTRLQEFSYQGFEDVATEYLDVVSKTLYESTLTGANFSAAVESAKAAIGGRMARYANQQIHDTLMQFDATINVAVGKEAGATAWKYVGSLVRDSREHCREHQNKVYTIEEIEEIWSGDWDGKQEGDPFKVRGGYNCGHVWRPVFED